MAITRTQIARQLLQFGGGADASKSDFGGKDRDRDRRDDYRANQYKKPPTKEQLQRARDFRDTQKVKQAFTKETIFDKIPSSLGVLTKMSKFNPKFMKEFAASNPDLLDYINSLDEDDQSSAKLASALKEIGYGDFLADVKGAPGLKFAGDVGGLGTKSAVRDIDGNIIGFKYDEPRDDRGGPDILLPQGIMTQAPSITEPEPEPEENEGLRLAFRAEGGPIGGEYDFESARQMYGLGKLVKKVTRTVKKIAKSPIGKAALIGGGLGLAGIGPFSGLAKTKLGTALGGFFGKGSFNPLLRKVGEDFAQSTFGSMLSSIPGGGVTAAIAGASALAGLLTPEQEEEAQELSRGEGIDIEAARRSILNAGTSRDFRARRFVAEGGSMKEPVAKKTMPLLDMGGKEMDLRAEGGFVPIGRMEKADDVPARLSKNEFVFTADAVRNAGDGDVDKGAEVMYNMMKNLEAGGDVSEESQGLEGARKMFQTSQRLEEVL